MSGHVSIPKYLGVPIQFVTMLVLSFCCPVRLQLRDDAMKYPSVLEDALVGAMALYDENGDKEALVKNLNGFR